MTAKTSLCPLLLFLCLCAAGCPADTDSPSGDNGGRNTANATNSMNTGTGTSTGQQGLVLGSLSPDSGSTLGGLEVEVRGAGFEGRTLTVFFGAQRAQQVQVTSDTLLQVTLPPALRPGRVDVKVSDTSGATATLAGAFTYLEATTTSVFCTLQAQSPASARAGEESAPLYALVFAQGLTPGAGQGQGVTAELGWGPPEADPDAYTFVPMSYNVDKDGLSPGDASNDEYGAALKIEVPGDYGYVARIKAAGLQEEWLYCDLDGSENGFSSAQAGRIEVREAVPASVEFCKLQAQSPATLTAGMPSDTLYAVVVCPGVDPRHWPRRRDRGRAWLGHDPSGAGVVHVCADALQRGQRRHHPGGSFKR